MELYLWDYLQETVEEVTADYLQRILLWVFILFLLGGLGTWLIARDIKMSIFGLEPSEIATLFRERNAILDSIREGVVAINDEGRITMLDHEAAKILDISPESGIGTPIESILPQTRMLEVLESGEEQFDQEMMIGDIEVVVNRVPIWQNERVTGVVQVLQTGNRPAGTGTDANTGILRSPARADSRIFEQTAHSCRFDSTRITQGSARFDWT